MTSSPLSSQPSRRGVLTAATLTALGAPIIASCSDGSGFPGRAPEPGEKIASVDDFEDGQTLVVMTSAGVPVVLRREGEEIIARNGVCPHGGCAVRVEVDNLLCPCHNSKFEFDGTFISGPANADLEPAEVTVEDGTIITA